MGEGNIVSFASLRERFFVLQFTAQVQYDMNDCMSYSNSPSRYTHMQLIDACVKAIGSSHENVKR